ncbi:hypothetical protein T4C_13404 [Trichinella pseudospiralis]|uniref:Uncharacterized protein n=1 Tax=Trichinella pseudospiralis TaxID=6337 RepID=A0A0V1IR64_TRIPS|nr:hypothetical protein T4C_13404 [Trichinella pseudospiralis]
MATYNSFAHVGLQDRFPVPNAGLVVDCEACWVAGFPSVLTTRLWRRRMSFLLCSHFWENWMSVSLVLQRAPQCLHNTLIHI